MNLVRRQSTINAPAVCAGIELHGGEHTRIVLKPAPVGQGIIFVRSDVTDRDNQVKAGPEAVTGVKNCTTLENAAGVKVSTIEHLMAALASVGIDNMTIDIDGHELPALDGSSEPFLKLIEQVGITKQPAPRRYVKILKTIEETVGSSSGIIEPNDRLYLDVTIDFEDGAIGKQRMEIEPDTRSFRDRLASARTFARAHEVAALREAGLSKGGSYDNAVVVDGDKVLNPGGLRYNDEFVRHKALDLMGDLYLAGPLLGKVTTVRGGHALNHALMTKLFADPNAWKFVSMPSENVDLGCDSVLA